MFSLDRNADSLDNNNASYSQHPAFIEKKRNAIHYSLNMLYTPYYLLKVTSLSLLVTVTAT